MIRYLLDTNICVDFLRGRNERAFYELSAGDPHAVGISTITFAELELGIQKSVKRGRMRVALAKLCAMLNVLPFDVRAAETYGLVRAQLERTGQTIGPLDMLIGAHAVSQDAILVTENEREFIRVPGLVTQRLFT